MVPDCIERTVPVNAKMLCETIFADLPCQVDYCMRVSPNRPLASSPESPSPSAKIRYIYKFFREMENRQTIARVVRVQLRKSKNSEGKPNSGLKSLREISGNHYEE